jgi:hypothetical protein
MSGREAWDLRIRKNGDCRAERHGKPLTGWCKTIDGMFAALKRKEPIA